MAIALRQSSSTTGAAVSTISPAIPTGTVYGDLMIAWVMGKNGSTAFTCNTLSGWNALAQQSAATNTLRQRIYWRPYETGDSAPSFTTSVAVAQISSVIVSYSGADLSTPILDFQTTTPGTAPHTSAALTFAARDAFALLGLNYGRGATTITKPAAYTNLQINNNQGGTGGTCWDVCHLATGGPNASAQTFTVANGSNSIITHVAVGVAHPRRQFYSFSQAVHRSSSM